MKFKFNENRKWSSVHDVNGWIKTIKQSGKNEDGKSALCLAQFCDNPNIEQIFKEWISSIIVEDFSLDYAKPEYSSRFDNFGKGRIHDLGIHGQTYSGKTIFLGVEAKVNETYNGIVSSIYASKKKAQLNGTSTQIPERIEGLISTYFPGKVDVNSDLRYQLLYAFAGTISEKCDYNILAFVTFGKYSKESSLKRNKKDLLNLLNKVDYEEIDRDLYKCEIAGKALYIIDKVL